MSERVTVRVHGKRERRVARAPGLWALCALFTASAAQADEPARAEAAAQVESSARADTTWLPGDARAITHATSASRDTALLDVIAYPRISVTLGGEFGLARVKKRGVSFAPGIFALFNLESRTKAKQLFPAPGGDSDLWRGILAYELTCAFEDVAERVLGERGGLELALGYYHESEHHSASNHRVQPGQLPDHPELRGRPQISDFFMLDGAVRGMWKKFEVVTRLQGKVFSNGPVSQHEPYRFAIGGDLLLRSRHHPRFQPFSASFGEVVHSSIARDANNLRSLLGVAIPGAFGELSLYLSLSTGAGKGLLLPVHDTDVGLGLKYSPFKS